MRGEDIDAAVTGSREGLDAAEKGNSNRSGSGVSLNADRDQKFRGDSSTKFLRCPSQSSACC